MSTDPNSVPRLFRFEVAFLRDPEAPPARRWIAYGYYKDAVSRDGGPTLKYGAGPTARAAALELLSAFEGLE